MTLSVVIATRDRAQFLARALESLASQDGAPEYEAIVADNGSSDATASVVTQRAAASTFSIRRVFVSQPNRAAARNAGIAAAQGRIVLFVDDDVWLPRGFLAAHAAAHAGKTDQVVSGPIINVRSYEERPKPKAANYSNAFMCTCNVSLSRDAVFLAGMFDESFNLYGWEDTELGLRLRNRGFKRKFAWDAYLYHLKPPDVETLDAVVRKTVERAHMAARLLAKDSGRRTRLATGAYALNMLRARVFAPAWSQGFARSLAENERLPAPLREMGRAQLLDVAYTNALRNALREGSKD